MKKTGISIVIAALLLIGGVPSYAAPQVPTMIDATIEEPTLTVSSLLNPKVTIDLDQANGKPAVGSKVTITSVTTGDKFSTITGKNGVIEFNPQIDSISLENSVGSTNYVTYDATFESPKGELSETYFSVPFVKEDTKLTQEDVDSLNIDRIQDIKVSFSGVSHVDELSKKMADARINQPQAAISALATKVMPSNCPSVGGTYYRCTTVTTKYTVPVKVSQANVSNGETVKLTFTSSAKIDLAVGIKASGVGDWGFTAGVQKSVDISTSVDYTATGTCQVFWGVTSCNNQRDFYANYGYVYTETETYNAEKVYVGTEYKTTPGDLIGAAPLTGNEWQYNASNGKTASSVAQTTNPYGYWFAVYNGAATTPKAYTIEYTYSGGISIPAIAFVADAKTAYKTSHSLTWSTTGTKTYYHYDMDFAGKNWYVTT